LKEHAAAAADVDGDVTCVRVPPIAKACPSAAMSNILLQLNHAFF
jgi:hypothetical protein